MPSIWTCPNCKRMYQASWGRCNSCGTVDNGPPTDESPRIDEGYDPLLEALRRQHPERNRAP